MSADAYRGGASGEGVTGGAAKGPRAPTRDSSSNRSVDGEVWSLMETAAGLAAASREGRGRFDSTAPTRSG